MELGQSEPLGPVDEHDRRIGHVDADFDDAGSHQKLYITAGKGFHDGFFLFPGHLSVDEAAAKPGKYRRPQLVIQGRGRLEVHVFRFFHEGTDDVTLLTGFHRLFHERIDAPAHGFTHSIGLDDLPSRWQVADGGHVEVAVQRQRQRAGNGRRRHVQRVRRPALFLQGFPLAHAKTVLFIGHDEPQGRKLHVVLDECVGADEDLHGSALQVFQQLRRSFAPVRPVSRAMRTERF